MPTPKREGLTQAQERLLTKLWGDGSLSLDDLGSQFGYSGAWISSVGRRMGLPKRATGPILRRRMKKARAEESTSRPLSPAMLHLAQFDPIIASVRDRQKEQDHD